MKKKFTFKLLLLIVLCISLYSCVHDEVTASFEPSSKEYTNKSLWKEDEKYIKNVKKIFETHADKQYFSNTYGDVYWDYAITMGTFDESFLEVPIVKNGRIKEILTVERRADKVYFKRKTEQNSNKFFYLLVFKNKTELKGTLNDHKNNAMSKGGGCITVSITWTWTNEKTGQVEMITTTSETRCLPVTGGGQTDPIGTSDCLEENCTGGGGGYTYPTEYIDNSPCGKLNAQKTDANFTAKVENLKTKTASSFESGYRVGSPVPGSGQTGAQYQELSNKPGTRQLDFKIFNTTYGIMHSHYDGLVPIFSPGDINTFIQLLQNAHTNNIPLSEVFISVVTSQGIYQLRGDGINVANLTMYTDDQIKALDTEYLKMIGNSNISTSDLQKGFLNFMKKNMNIDGAKLFEINNDGDSKELQVSSNNNLVSANCPK
ncbi:hypothetical protein [Chryseobacterium sp. LAM-KRS1]|uniref:hypothetical protein n=1 Tax=Chryseobacterium sp. LAM-KRS1 TaxID=2715754 RepID=UPI0015517A16|nr:hypothetical protein [Chryseobacterium sp. LAM-KRS1]